MDYIDTRDLAERREELRAELDESYKEMILGLEIEQGADIEEAVKQWTEDNKDELEEIKEIDYIENEVSEFSHGETLIPECEFENYVRDMVKDCGYIDKEMPWWIVIDWEETSNNIAQDYSTIEYGGNTYYYRN